MVAFIVKYCVLIVFVALEAEAVRRVNAPPVTEQCLECLCQARTGCDHTTKCADSMCGMFSITRPYWIDAGRLTVNDTDDGKPRKPLKYPDCESDPDCKTCANDVECAIRTVRAYMKRFPSDCNEDGVVDCYDYLAIHMKGGYGCAGDLPQDYVALYKHCDSAVAAQRV